MLCSWRRQLRLGMRVTWLAAAFTCLTVPTVAFAASNRPAVRAYLRDVYKYERVVFTKIGLAKADYGLLASRISNECAGVISGSAHQSGRSTTRWPGREFEQIGDLREEVYAALDDALLAPDRRALFVLVVKLRNLRWDTPSLRRRVDAYATALERRVTQRVPNACSDMRAWAASGYRTLSAASRTFLDEYKPPRRLVIYGGAPPTMRRTPATRLRLESRRYDRPVLVKIRLVRRRIASALNRLVGIDKHWERKLGFPVLRR